MFNPVLIDLGAAARRAVHQIPNEILSDVELQNAVKQVSVTLISMFKI